MVDYPEAHEQDMIALFDSLSEKDRRRYAAIEAKKLGHGGIDYICSLFGLDDKTVTRGMKDIEDKTLLEQKGVRRTGGGRKKTEEKESGLDQAFLDTLRNHTAGDPMDDAVKWTALSRQDIAKALNKKGFDVSRNIIRQLLKKHGFVKRKMKKSKSTGEFKERNRQFKKIARLKKSYEKQGNPIISVDTKKKRS